MDRDALIGWMLDSDPSLRWQVERDLVGAPPAVWEATRARIATEGFGARLLALQDPEGTWAHGAFFPVPFDPAEAGQPWTATTWSLKSLREWGLDAAVLAGTADRLAGVRWEYEDLPYWGGEVDVCINAWTLANGAWLGVDVAPLARWFVEHRLADGGWNCEWVDGATRSSFHSTINALTGLLDWEERTGGDPGVRAARRAGEEYLLHRHLLRRASTGERVGTWVGDLTSPPRWRYSALRAIEHLRRAAILDGTSPDPRAEEAVELLRRAAAADGRVLQTGRDPGRVWFETDVEPGQPSRPLTFRVLRALDWWDSAH